MTEIDYLQIIKWVLIVLAAGFIGQFGKSLATYLIHRTKRTKPSGPSETAIGFVEEPGEATQPPPASERTELQGKAEKKASKALIKMRKKER
jgi:hypothetical protein